jgi:hypothetical protein
MAEGLPALPHRLRQAAPTAAPTTRLAHRSLALTAALTTLFAQLPPIRLAPMAAPTIRLARRQRAPMVALIIQPAPRLLVITATPTIRHARHRHRKELNSVRAFGMRNILQARLTMWAEICPRYPVTLPLSLDLSILRQQVRLAHRRARLIEQAIQFPVILQLLVAAIKSLYQLGRVRQISANNDKGRNR